MKIIFQKFSIKHSHKMFLYTGCIKKNRTEINRHNPVLIFVDTQIFNVSVDHFLPCFPWPTSASVSFNFEIATFINPAVLWGSFNMAVMTHLSLIDLNTLHTQVRFKALLRIFFLQVSLHTSIE